MPSLHDLGWRQGTVFEADLKVLTYGFEGGHCTPIEATYELWVVTSQDCDLHALESDSHDRVIEISPAVPGKSSLGWGIRSRQLRLSADVYVEAEAPRLKLSPQALSAFASTMWPDLEEGRAVAFKTWLGRRYDRPAVPTAFVRLAQDIAKQVKAARTPERANACHDVLFQIREGDPLLFELTAIAADLAHAAELELWLTEAALLIDPSLGVMDSPPLAVTKSELSLNVLENSYSADLSEITWKKEDPKGAT